MSTGFVYIMINPAFINQVKIGITTRTSEERAKELSTTGVPEEFIVVYDELVNNCEAVENELHKKFSFYRENKSREFFRIPIKQAIKELQAIAKQYSIDDTQVERVSILSSLQTKYNDYLKKGITEINIAHLNNVCFLEIVRISQSVSGSDIPKAPWTIDQFIDRIDLSFVISGFDIYDPLFPLTNSVNENAEIFIEKLDAYRLINICNIFTEEACNKIAKEHLNKKV